MKYLITYQYNNVTKDLFVNQVIEEHPVLWLSKFKKEWPYDNVVLMFSIEIPKEYERLEI